jgi:hypothetical protein
MWNFFRVEKEHVENIGEFKVVEKVDLPFKL